jgi:hypothetical protein
VAGVASAGDEAAALPNKPLASCSSTASRLSVAMSTGEAFCSADCTDGVDRAEEIDEDPVLDSNCDKSAIPGFTELTALIEVLIGRNP